MAPVPDMTDEQRRESLHRAMEARTERARLKAEVKAGRVTLAEALAMADESPVVGRMRVRDLLRSLPGWGRGRADRWMKANHIPEGRRVRGLGSRQRAALLEAGE